MVNEGHYSNVFGFNVPHLVVSVFPFLHPDSSNYAQFVFNVFRFRALALPGVFALAVFGGAPPGGALRLPDAGGRGARGAARAVCPRRPLRGRPLRGR